MHPWGLGERFVDVRRDAGVTTSDYSLVGNGPWLLYTGQYGPFGRELGGTGLVLIWTSPV